MTDNKKEEYSVEKDFHYIQATTILKLLSQPARYIGLELAEVEFEGIEHGTIRLKRCIFKRRGGEE